MKRTTSAAENFILSIAQNYADADANEESAEAACRIAFNDEQFAFGRVAPRAVGKFAGEHCGIERRFFPLDLLRFPRGRAHSVCDERFLDKRP